MQGRGISIICIVTEDRDDGGLRIHSPDVPGLHLSGANRDAVMRDVIPAIKHLFKANNGVDVEVSPIQPSLDELFRDVQTDPMHDVIAAIQTGRVAVSKAIH